MLITDGRVTRFVIHPVIHHGATGESASNRWLRFDLSRHCEWHVAIHVSMVQGRNGDSIRHERDADVPHGPAHGRGPLLGGGEQPVGQRDEYSGATGGESGEHLAGDVCWRDHRWRGGLHLRDSVLNGSSEHERVGDGHELHALDSGGDMDRLRIGRRAEAVLPGGGAVSGRCFLK